MRSLRAPRLTGWSLVALFLAGVVALPILVVLSRVTADSGGTWQHLAETVLSTYLANTAWLLLGVGVGTIGIGVTTAWLVTMVDFPGRRILTWALLLPLAMPTYLMAYTYTDLLQFSGPLQSWLRETFGWSRGDYWFPEIRSLGGAVVTFSFVLYPYVYLLSRAAFLEQSLCTLEVSRTLGSGPWQAFRAVALPLARPAIVAGSALALMETLAEYGAVDYFAVDTFSTGIYRTWTSLASPEAASQLASVMVLFVLVILVLERTARGRARYHALSTRDRQLRPPLLSGARGWCVLALCSVPVVFGFLIPAVVLLRFVFQADLAASWSGVPGLVANTLTVALVTVFTVVLLGLVLAYACRLDRHPLTRLGSRVVSLGYVIPGSVAAVGVLVTLSGLNRMTGLLLGGTLAALVFAYAVRFSAISVQTLQSGLERIRPSMDDAARTLGRRPGNVLWSIHSPLLRGSLLTAALLVFVDVMKELPATMILRPLNFDTLAVRVHNYASDERLAQSALPALLIVAAGLGPVILLSHAIDRSRRRSASRIDLV